MVEELLVCTILQYTGTMSWIHLCNNMICLRSYSDYEWRISAASDDMIWQYETLTVQNNGS